MFFLKISRGGTLFFQRPLDKQKITIGRDPFCDIQLLDNEISRKHCVLEKTENDWRLTNQSRNGTWFHHKKIDSYSLKSDDCFEVGPWQILFCEGFSQQTAETFIHKKQEMKESALGNMLGASSSMQAVFENIRKSASSDATICLIGESGTGKELAAHLLHQLSPRRGGPFVALNCGAIPENLVESLLFGHERGAFTGASEKQIGVFEQANHGTLFLDEIGEMPLPLQTRLLRVLETKKVRRIGSAKEITIDTRLIVATHRDLATQVAHQKFRTDLFYRLFVFPIELPPLRKRPEDIPLLAEYFLTQFQPSEKKISLTPEAMEKLQKHLWPGNVRELKNVIQRALLLCDQEKVETRDIDWANIAGSSLSPTDATLADKERMVLVEALRKSRGNQTQAARHLGIARTTLTSKLERYQIQKTEWS